jgi:hypothetical protein
MSKDTYRWDSPQSSATWKKEVIKRRGAFSARLKLARRIKERGSSFWPSVVASEVRQGFQDRSRGMKGSQESLTTAVVKDWPSASSRDWKGAPASRITPEGYNARLDEAVILFGQVVPANRNLNGNRQGSLNPRWVETLMGLPIGWTMPSCTSPQTIAPMSCDSSAMELSQPPQSELSEFSLAS